MSDFSVKLRRAAAAILCTVLFCTLLAGCAAQAPGSAAAEQAESTVAGRQAETGPADSHTAEQLEKEIGAFEIAALQRELAAQNEKGLEPLDAGRGNPNWINTQARYAFARFMEFAVEECERTFSEGTMAGATDSEGLAERFYLAMDPEDETDSFLIKSVGYCSEKLGIEKNELLEEFANGIIGDYYPSPGRCLKNTEIILNEYLQDTLYSKNKLAGETKVFPTEGGTAAICYIFNSLHHNLMLNDGDKIAIAEPIFTPYLQIPDVNNYGLVSIKINSTEEGNWDLPEEAYKVLSDPETKAFFLVNPSNPASHQLSKGSLEKIAGAVKNNPDLIIITDDVYGTFVNDFQTVYSVVPHNTLLVYSFSKIYGATGWRVGLIAMNEKNVVDDRIAALPEEDRQALRNEYAIVTDDPDAMPFVERMVADSRSIGLYHTSGLSTPQQIFMDFLALTHLVCEGDDPYFRLSNDIIDKRYKALINALGLPYEEDADDARYYALIDIYDIAKNNYGPEFADWMRDNIDDLLFLKDFAGKYGVVLMYGPGFAADNGSVRVSLANLNEEGYVEIAERMFKLMDEYYERFEAE